jgi:hypothetical protein
MILYWIFIPKGKKVKNNEEIWLLLTKLISLSLSNITNRLYNYEHVQIILMWSRSLVLINELAGVTTYM